MLILFSLTGDTHKRLLTYCRLKGELIATVLRHGPSHLQEFINVFRCCYFFAEDAKAWVGVVRDSSGTSVWCCSSFWAGYKDPMVAEGMAIREVQSWLKWMGLDNIIIESNCPRVVGVLQSEVVNDSTVLFMIVSS